jgi:hypothetical protein
MARGIENRDETLWFRWTAKGLLLTEATEPRFVEKPPMPF